MIGIKGVGMTMLAQYLAAVGVRLSGSDTGETFMTDKVLEQAGIPVTAGFDPANIDPKAELIIHSSAYTADTNPEVAAAQSGSVPVMNFAQALGAVFSGSYGIAVCGSHGKTTTSAWLGYVLDRAGKSPSVLVGARVPQFSGSSLIGKSDYMVIEADEYQNKLQYYKPQAALINNIDFDHPDVFAGPDDYRAVFADFIANLPKRGFLVINNDDRELARLAEKCPGHVISYALRENADYVAYDIRNTPEAQTFRVKLGVSPDPEEEETGDLGEFTIRLQGEHNIYNALAVIATATELGLELSEIRAGLEAFTGTARRLEKKGKYRGAAIIDDYAHHPTEVKTTLQAVRRMYPKEKITVVFHPHTFSRTKALLDEFAAAFAGADELMVLDIYGSAREAQGGVHSQDLIERIRSLPEGEKPARIHYRATLAEAEEYLRGSAGPGQVILLMGAGDVFRIGDSLAG